MHGWAPLNYLLESDNPSADHLNHLLKRDSDIEQDADEFLLQLSLAERKDEQWQREAHASSVLAERLLVAQMMSLDNAVEASASDDADARAPEGAAAQSRRRDFVLLDERKVDIRRREKRAEREAAARTEQPRVAVGRSALASQRATSRGVGAGVKFQTKASVGGRRSMPVGLGAATAMGASAAIGAKDLVAERVARRVENLTEFGSGVASRVQQLTEDLGELRRAGIVANTEYLADRVAKSVTSTASGAHGRATTAGRRLRDRLVTEGYLG